MYDELDWVVFEVTLDHSASVSVCRLTRLVISFVHFYLLGLGRGGGQRGACSEPPVVGADCRPCVLTHM